MGHPAGHAGHSPTGWDATEAELGELRAGIAAALRAAGREVHEAGTQLYVPRSGLEDAGLTT